MENLKIEIKEQASDLSLTYMGGLGDGHKGLFDTVNNSLHFQLGLALASVGTITSFCRYYYFNDRATHLFITTLCFLS